MMTDCTIDWAEIRQASGPCIRPGGPVLTEEALRFCNLPSGSIIADIGCGAGGTLKRLERTGIYSTVGIDISEPLLAEAASHLASGRFILGCAESLPFKHSTFDAVFCECVLSILNDRVTALTEFARVLKEGGFLILSDVFRQDDAMKLKHAHGNRILGKDDIFRRLTMLNFSILLWEDHKNFLKEFAARMIMAGERLPEQWCCGFTKESIADRSGISYFLLVAKKNATEAVVSNQPQPRAR
jgi:arsenite methyltransferase